MLFRSPELVQKVLVNIVHLFGVHRLGARVKALQVPQQEFQSVSQLSKEEKNKVVSPRPDTKDVFTHVVHTFALLSAH